MDLLKIIFEQTSIGIAVFDHSYRLIRSNQSFNDAMGYDNDEHITKIIPEIDQQQLDNVITNGTPYRLLVEKNSNHKKSYINVIFSVLTNDASLKKHIICEASIDNSRHELEVVIQSFEIMIENYKQQVHIQSEMLITADRERSFNSAINHDLENSVRQRNKELSRVKQELAHQAYHDVLTGLANRRLFNEKISQSVKNTQRANTNLAVLYLGLDQFKKINDSLGHYVGDSILTQAAQRLRAIVRTNDTVARMGGDEFAIIIEHADQDAIEIIAQKINNAIVSPFTVDSRVLTISTSIGICMFTEFESQVTPSDFSIIQAADVAMYEVKTNAGNGYVFFTHAMLSKVNQRLSMEVSLKRAIDNNELILHYQPKLNLSTGRLSGCEALVRWQHPEQGLLYPDAFISLAEESGLMSDLGAWVMQHAFEQLTNWRNDNINIGTLAINLSSKQLESKLDQNKILKLLIDSGLPPESIELELTESVLMDQQSTSGIEFLEQLKLGGYAISMDDFGTGYSSLSYLRYLPVSTLKIDRSFISSIMCGEQENALVLAIIAIAKTMGLKIIAEGIESQHQLNFLVDHQCDEGQGDYLSPPLDAQELVRYVTSRQHVEIV